ncbi:hypothetical protein FNV43_RR20444 [Rhamnella rubrinervis]|uniref:Uncharacterized protein n=1 Tax=Rhamnella rubrinervis TaxID=2594499 RepID=A0A8K0E0D9_9ROSA|nr:hypothetical protein FNV43_RR20444 [Rhamnella rubrinervis]
MGFLAYREAILILFIGFLVLQPVKVSGLGSKDLALRWRTKLHLPFLRDLHIVKDVALEDLQRKLSVAPAPSVTFDPNQSGKRGVRRGSDPIHNRC